MSQTRYSSTTKSSDSETISTSDLLNLIESDIKYSDGKSYDNDNSSKGELRRSAGSDTEVRNNSSRNNSGNSSGGSSRGNNRGSSRGSSTGREKRREIHTESASPNNQHRHMPAKSIQRYNDHSLNNRRRPSDERRRSTATTASSRLTHDNSIFSVRLTSQNNNRRRNRISADDE